MGLRPGSQSLDCTIKSYVNTSYDNVKTVSDNIDDVNKLASEIDTIKYGAISFVQEEVPSVEGIAQGARWYKPSEPTMYIYYINEGETIGSWVEDNSVGDDVSLDTIDVEGGLTLRQYLDSLDTFNTTIDGRVTTLETDVSNLTGRVTTNETKLTSIETGAQVNTVNSVAGKTGTVTLDGSDISVTGGSLQTKLDSIDSEVDEVKDSLTLKVFQSPTDNLTKVTTYVGSVGTVFEVRKTSDNTLADIYSDKDGITSIPQNGTANVSNGDAESVFYIAAGDYSVTVGAESEFFSALRDMSIINSLENFAVGSKPSTGGTKWLINDVSGLPLPNGLFARPLNGIFLDDFGVDNTGVDSIDDALDDAILSASYVGGKVKVRGGDSKYLLTRQHTILHGVSVDFSYAEVDFVQATTNNDSPFQMGNNTQLKNISKATYKSSSLSSFTTFGIVKIGEFYAEINGNPNPGDNSIDSTYWEVENVSVENIKGFASGMDLNTDRSFTATVYIVGGTNVNTNNIYLDGLAGDGIPVPAMSAIRTETGYDVNARRQGFNLKINNTIGTNLRAHPENAVVYINGDRNTHVVNVHGEDCGQIFACNTNGNSSNQSPELLGKNGINIKAENVTGLRCKKYSGDTFTKLVAGVNIKGEAPEDQTENNFVVNVSNVYLKGISDASLKLNFGISIGDALGSNIDNSRIEIKSFNISDHSKGFLIDDTCKGVVLENGRSHHNQTNGGDFKGDGNILRNVKMDSNNRLGNTDANGFNGHGLNYAAKNGLLDSCKFGDIDLPIGSETQLRSISVTANDSTGVLKNCQVHNYKTGQSDIEIRSGVTGSFLDIQKDCKGIRNIASNYPIYPHVAIAECNANADGTGNYLVGCTVSKVSTGRYRIVFDKELPDANYAITTSALGGANADVNTDYVLASTTQFDVYTKVSGIETDAPFSAVVHGNSASTF